MNQLVIKHAGLAHIHDELISSCHYALNSGKFKTRELQDGGIQVTDNIMSMDSSFVFHLERVVRSSILEQYPGYVIAELRVFVNYNPPFDHDSTYHDHPEFDVGAVYYPTGTGIDGGELEFIRPYVLISPEDDMLVIFPSSYRHRVLSYRGPSRYSIAFNCRFKR